MKWFLCVVWVKGSTLFFFMGFSICSNTITCPFNGFGTIVENQLTMDTRVYFWALDSNPSIYMNVFVLSSLHCFADKFWNQEVWVFQFCSSFSSLFGLFSIPWKFIWNLYVMNFRNQLISCYKEATWDSDSSCIVSVDQFKEHCHLPRPVWLNWLEPRPATESLWVWF